MSKHLNTNALNAITKSGEIVLWTGSPTFGIRLPTINTIPLYFSSFIVVVFFALSITRPIFLLWAVPGALTVVIYIIVYLLIRARIIYRVTNQRIIIFSNFMSQSIRQINVESIKEIELQNHHDDTGTITFDKKSWLSLFYWSPNPTSSLLPPRFEFINAPNEVYKIIQKIREN
jgi:hypothetical protein